MRQPITTAHPDYNPQIQGLGGGTQSGGNGITMKGARGVVRVSHMSRDGNGGANGEESFAICLDVEEKTVDGFNYE